jgi:hypothetical protein
LDEAEQGGKPQRHRDTHATINAVKTLLVVALVACSGPAKPQHVERPLPVVTDAAPPPETGPTGAECDQLLEHALVLATPPGKKLSESELANARAKMHDAFTSECLAMPRDRFQCAMTAPSMPELAACDQATRSSSTSNSSVAPGGITPAAPRSP